MNTKHLLRKLPSCLLGAIFAAGIASTTMVNAVDGTPPGLFELDSNIPDGGGAGDDWESLYLGTNLGTPIVTTMDEDPASSTFGTLIVSDPAPKSIFTQGGSKDINDVSDWRHTDGSVPDKDDITHAFAAAYSNTANVGPHEIGDLIVYFGFDRYANNGEANGGFWFFQNETHVAANGTFVDGSGNPATHVEKRPDPANPGSFLPGDVFLIVAYPQGANAEPIIKAYEWDPNDADGDGNVDPSEKGGKFSPLDLLLNEENAKCDGTGGKLACATTNTADDPAFLFPAGWNYTPKSGTGLPHESFYEGGINIGKVLGGNACFSSFLAETRSSASQSAQLKDFVLASFAVCGAEVTKSCEATINQAGDQVDVAFDGTASNTGGLTLYVELSDDQAGSMITAVCVDAGADGCDGGDALPANLNSLPAATATFDLAPGQTVRYEGAYTVTQFNNETSFTDTVTLEFFEDSSDTVPIDTKTAQATCPPVGTPGISVFKDCINPNIQDGNTFIADIIGSVTNTGNVKLVNVMLSDTVFSFGDLTVVRDANKNGLVDGGEAAFSNGGDLAAGEQLAYSAQVSSGTPSHSNTLTASGANFFDNSETVSAFDDASCAPNLNPDLTIAKVCDDTIGGGTGVQLVIDNGQVVVEVGNVITVTNTGNEDLVNVTISDSDVQTLVKMSGGANLTCTGNSCTGSMDNGEVVVLQQTYRPDGQNIIGALTLPGGVAFNNTASAEGTGVLSGTPLGPLTADASCVLCP